MAAKVASWGSEMHRNEQEMANQSQTSEKQEPTVQDLNIDSFSF